METPVTIIKMTVEVTLYDSVDEDGVEAWRGDLEALIAEGTNVHKVGVILDDVQDSGIDEEE